MFIDTNPNIKRNPTNRFFYQLMETNEKLLNFYKQSLDDIDLVK